MKQVESYPVSIYVGFKNIKTNQIVGSVGLIELICQRFCNEIGLCVTVTPTKFIYTDGSEPGCIVGLINYPRFPDSKENILSTATSIAGIFKFHCEQQRISIVAPDVTIMIESDKAL
jgi:hypothetical protein